MIIYSVGETLKKTDEIPAEHGEKRLYLVSESEFEKDFTNIAHKKTVMHCLCVPEYTKVQFFGSCVVGAVFVPDKENAGSVKAHIGFYIAENEMYLVGDESYTVNLAGRIREAKLPAELTLCGLFCMMLNILIDDDFRFLQKTEKTLIQLEDSLNKGADDGFDIKILPYRRLMMCFQSHYYQLMNMGMAFRSNINHMLTEDDVMSFTYYTRRSEMLHMQVQTLRDYIFHIRETYRTDIAVRQSRSMNMLTVVTSLFMPLSLIAGWYGMNFEFMPELDSPAGYPSVIAVSLAVVVAGLIFFRRKRLL